MATGRIGEVVRRLRSTALADHTDGQLLDRYLADRSEDAFAALLHRHGPMVLGVCRRLLGNGADVDDAFQATFLVLIRKAASVRPRELVGHWLYGVAYRTALEARTMAARRRAKERAMPNLEIAAAETADDLRPALDRELNALPESYRAAIVLCDLEGKTRKEAARQLGCPEGTLAGRLTRARALLARRLAKHGLTLSAGALATALATEASAGVPSALMQSTILAATAGAIPARVAALTEGVLKAMFINRLKRAFTVLVLLGFLGVSAGISADGPPPPPRPTEKNTLGEEIDRRIEIHGKLPTTPPPVQGLASLAKDGKLVVKLVSINYKKTEFVQPDGKKRQFFEPVTNVRAETYDLANIMVHDIHGKRIQPKQLAKLLKQETPALISMGVQEVDPLHLRLFKDGTLVFCVPFPDPSPAPVPAAEPPSVNEPAPDRKPRAPSEQLLQPPSDPDPLPKTSAHEYSVSSIRDLRIPINIDRKRADEIDLLHLFVSRDLGKSWKRVAAVVPPADAFTYHVPEDGLYWFALEIEYKDGRRDPTPAGKKMPALKVIVGTGTP